MKRITAIILIICIICFGYTDVVNAIETGGMDVWEYINQDLPVTETGIAGDNGGFNWTYNTDTRIIVVTGEDSGFSESVFYNYYFVSEYGCDKLIFNNCTFYGDMVFDVAWYGDELIFQNCDATKTTSVSINYGAISRRQKLDLRGLDISNLTNISNLLDKFMCPEIDVIYTPKNVSSTIPLPRTYYDLKNTPTTAITPEFCNTVLVRSIDQQTSNVATAEEYRIKVVDSSGRPIENAVVDYGSYCGNTDENGEILLDTTLIGDTQLIDISKSGYITDSLAYADCKVSGNYYEVILYRENEGNYKLKKADYSSTDLASRNILLSTKTLNLKNTGNYIGDLTSGDFKISCEAVDAANVSEYQLWQKNAMIAQSADGIFSLNVEQGFVEGAGCYIRVISKDGKQVDTDINLAFVPNYVNEVSSIKLMNGAVEIDVADNVPFFGGSDIEIDMPELPVNIGFTDEKMIFSFNLKEYDSSEGKTQKQFYEDVKSDFNTLKKVKSALATKNLKKLIKNDNSMSLPGGKFQFNIVGYAEVNWGEDMAKGELYIEVKGKSPTLGFTTWCIIAPVTVQFNATASGKVIGEISYDYTRHEFCGAGLNIEVEVGCHAFGGIGLGKIAGAGAYGDAKAELEFKLLGKDNGLQKFDLTGELGLEAYIACFKYPRAFAHNTWHLYTPNETATAVVYCLEEEPTDSFFNADNYKVDSLDYLSEESVWNGYPIMLNDAEASTNLMPLLENTYLNAQPVMVADGDVLYSAFLGADETTNEIYVLCTKMENGVWCEPVRVDSEAILDNAPQLLVDEEGNVWLAYAKTGLDADTSSLLSYAQNQSIVIGTLDKETLAFTEVKEYDSTDYEHMQQLSLVNGVPTLAWVESVVADDNSVLSSFDNKVVSASYNNGEWSEQAEVKQLDYYIGEFAFGDMGIVCIVDMNADLQTLEDRTLLYCDWQGDKISTVAGVTGNVTYGTLPGETESTFIWNDTDKLCSFDSSIDVEGITNEYVINGNSIYYSVPVSDGAELAVIRRNNDGTYSNPIQLTDTDRYLENLSVATAYGKDIVLGMHTSAEITEESVNTSKNLVWSIVQPVNDILINEVYYDTSVTTPNETLEVTLTVTNAGENVVDEINISIDGNVVETKTVALQPGASTDIAFEMAYPECLTEYTVKIEDTASDISLDYNLDNNSKTLKLGQANLKINASLRKIGDSKTIVAELVNNGTDVASGTVALFDEDGQLLSLKSFTDLQRDNTMLIELPLHFEISGSSLSVVVNTEQEELYTYDNTDTVYVPVEEEKYTITYGLNGGVQNEANPTFYFESSEIIGLYEPTKEGYVFDGWYSDSEYIVKVMEIDTSKAEDITLFAKWVKEELPLTITAQAESSQITVGDKIVINATAIGGDGNYTYSFLVHNKDTKKWSRLSKSFTESSSYIWAAPSAGRREFFVEVKDGTGKVVRSDALNINVSEIISIRGEATSSLISVGDSIQLIGTVMGDDGDYTYSYLVHNKDTGKWARLTKEFVENNSYTWKASTVGDREFFIEVKDRAGNIVRSKAINVKVVDKFTVIANSSLSKARVGDEVVLSGEVIGDIGEYTYSFIIYNKLTHKWYRLANNIMINNYTWKAGCAGERVFYIDVKDSTGKIVRSNAVEVDVE